MGTDTKAKNPFTLSDGSQPERVTVVAESFPPAAMEFHRRNMAAHGYRMEGRVAHRVFYRTDGLGAPEPLFDGKLCYAVTFVHRGEEEE